MPKMMAKNSTSFDGSMFMPWPGPKTKASTMPSTSAIVVITSK
jgi:hypothetical protein